MPNILELEKTQDVWARKSDLPGIVSDLDEQLATLTTICLPYQAEYAGNEVYLGAAEAELGPGYGYIEAQTVHAVIRHYKPHQIVEVGSGVSTACMLHALQMNEAEGADGCQVTCIEPYPTEALQRMNGISLIEKPVQRVPYAEVFSQLKENDLLFIDSSHTVKPDSDVNYLILEILPRLAPGVIVHFHDIYLPYDHGRDVLQTYFHWMETSLLRAFLIHNRNAEILFCHSQLHYDRQEGLKMLFPAYNPQIDQNGIRDKKYPPFTTAAEEHFPRSIYIKIK